MRVVLFGSGSPLSLCALETLSAAARVVAVVVPAPGKVRGARSAARALGRWRGRRGLVDAAARRGIPVLRHGPGADAELAAGLRRLEPDLACVATFPRLLSASTLAVPRRGTLGVHPSLLPRHRGPAPLFWTYLDDDAEAGVTVHWLDAGEDTGDVVFQEGFPLARGRPGADLYAEIARRGAALLARALSEIEAGTAPQTPQDPSRVTREPAPESGGWGIDFEAWGAERVWHFLRGVEGMVIDAVRPLSDGRGRVILHGPVRGYRLEPQAGRRGEIERGAEGFRLVCRDGVVELETASLSRRAWWTLRRLVAFARGRPAAPSPRRRAAAGRTGTRSSA
jgi:methionyl-tRNA formyltransferase